MMKIYAMWIFLGLVTFGCEEKEEESVNWDRIVQLFDEDETPEWKTPKNDSFISDYTSPEEEELSDNESYDFIR